MEIAQKRELYRVEKTDRCILEILAYFAVFDYPLTGDEIRKFMPPARRSTVFENDLEKLVAEKVVFNISEFYMLRNEPEWVNRRRAGNARAKQVIPKATRVGRFLSRFPYVRGIGISGSLSKDYAHEKADFDYFIITKSNRLWIARTLMHLFKKLTFITGRQHHYCMNYYLDEQALKLRDQNMYTAIEIFTLIPVEGQGIHDFFAANAWVANWFAAYSPDQSLQQKHRGKIKQFAEWLMNNRAGDKLDNWLMRLTASRWRKKEEQHKLNYEGKEMSLVTGKHHAWSNPDSFQEKILALYHEKLAELKLAWPQYFQPLSLSFEE
jgi:hypothetical protein